MLEREEYMINNLINYLEVSPTFKLVFRSGYSIGMFPYLSRFSICLCVKSPKLISWLDRKKERKKERKEKKKGFKVIVLRYMIMSYIPFTFINNIYQS